MLPRVPADAELVAGAHGLAAREVDLDHFLALDGRPFSSCSVATIFVSFVSMTSPVDG